MLPPVAVNVEEPPRHIGEGLAIKPITGIALTVTGVEVVEEPHSLVAVNDSV